MHNSGQASLANDSGAVNGKEGKLVIGKPSDYVPLNACIQTHLLLCFLSIKEFHNGTNNLLLSCICRL